MQTYKGGCHCQAVRFEVEMELTKAMECNCSHCYLKGMLLAFVPGENVTILSGEEMLTEYRFNKEHIAHLFCKVCGAQPFGRANDAEGKLTYAINVRCLEGVDAESLEINQFDGKSL